MTNEMFQEPSNLKKSNEKAPSNYQNPVSRTQSKKYCWITVYVL